MTSYFVDVETPALLKASWAKTIVKNIRYLNK